MLNFLEDTPGSYDDVTTSVQNQNSSIKEGVFTFLFIYCFMCFMFYVLFYVYNNTVPLN